MSPQIEIEVKDRHSEHVDPNRPLCDHGYPTMLHSHDRLKVDVVFGSEVIAEMHVELVSKGRLRIVVNHLDYLIAKAKQPC